MQLSQIPKISSTTTKLFKKGIQKNKFVPIFLHKTGTITSILAKSSQLVVYDSRLKQRSPYARAYYQMVHVHNPRKKTEKIFHEIMFKTSNRWYHITMPQSAMAYLCVPAQWNTSLMSDVHVKIFNRAWWAQFPEHYQFLKDCTLALKDGTLLLRTQKIKKRALKQRWNLQQLGLKQ